jgi:hypothetical protein
MQAMTAGTKLIADNRRARHEYHLLDRYEAGLALTGTEVKSLRDGKAVLQRAFGDVRDGEIYLVGLHIPEYTQGNAANHDPDRDRKLLLHRREIDQLSAKVARGQLVHGSTGRTAARRSSSPSPAARTCATSAARSPTATRNGKDDRVDDGGRGEEGGDRPERDEAVRVQARVGHEQPDH